MPINGAEYATFWGAVQHDPDLAGFWDFFKSGSSGSAEDYTTKATVKQGSTGADVTSLQKALLALGYAPSSGGTFDEKTKTAVTSFQKDHGLSVDGIVGPNTWAALAVEVDSVGGAGKKGLSSEQAMTLATAAAGLITAFIPSGASAPATDSTYTPDVQTPAPTVKWGWPQYAMVGGGVVVLGVLSYIVYKQFAD